ncbi:MAG TPA: hypothetical protein PKX32_03120 [Candidatus Saccharicenans sp.]|nr:hypothetical protein [Candidatus Saccharicenans sp.]
MKKLTSLTLSLIFILSIFLFLPQASQARVSADECWDNWERCRARALQSDYGTVRTTLALTSCDIGLGRCIIMGN